MNIIDDLRAEAEAWLEGGEDAIANMLLTYADLLAASGALVPVPDREAVRLENLEESALFMNDGALMKFARFHPSNFCKCIYVDSGKHTALPWNTIVQPVRLVRLEDVSYEDLSKINIAPENTL